MVSLPSFDLTVRMVDLGAAGVDVDAGASRSEVDISVSTPVAAVSLTIGLDRLLSSSSPIDRLLHSPDPLSRFRAGDVPSDPSPAQTRGMTLRVGDLQAEVATRYAIGGASAASTDVRADVRLGGDPLVSARAGAGADTRGVGAVRDAVESAALPQRIDGPAGATAGERGIGANVALGGSAAQARASLTVNVSVGGGPVVSGTVGVASVGAASVSFGGLVNVLDRPGAPILTARNAPSGAVLLYARADGSTVVELRTAQGFADATRTSTLPLTGGASGRTGDGFTLIGVFVAGGASVATLWVGDTPLNVAATPDGLHHASVAPGLPSAGATTVNLGTAPTQTVPTAAPHPAAPIAEGATAARAGREGGGVPVSFGADAAGMMPPPDGSTIPAGQPALPSERRAGFGDAPSNDDASDRPYIHSIWYDILALRFADVGVSLLDRSTALRDVVWAMAIEHGPFAAADGSDVLSRVAANLDLTCVGDAEIVAAIYAERARIDADGRLAHYPEVLPFDQARVLERLADEADLAARRIVTR